MNTTSSLLTLDRLRLAVSRVETARKRSGGDADRSAAQGALRLDLGTAR